MGGSARCSVALCHVQQHTQSMPCTRPAVLTPASPACPCLPLDRRCSVAREFRPRSDAVVATVAQALTEGLGAYGGASTEAQASKVQLWDERGAALRGPLAQVA